MQKYKLPMHFHHHHHHHLQGFSLLAHSVLKHDAFLKIIIIANLRVQVPHIIIIIIIIIISSSSSNSSSMLLPVFLAHFLYFDKIKGGL
jgi:hypothetical protein